MSTPVLDILQMAQRLGEQQGLGQTRQSFVPPPRALPRDRTDDLVAASLAAGMIAAGGKAVSAEEAVGVYQAVRDSLGR